MLPPEAPQPSSAEKTAALRELLASRAPVDAAEEGLSGTQLRDKLILQSPGDADWVAQINQVPVCLQDVSINCCLSSVNLSVPEAALSASWLHRCLLTQHLQVHWLPHHSASEPMQSHPQLHSVQALRH